MIELDLTKQRELLRGFLTIGNRWLFVPGYVYTTTKEKQVFARMAAPALQLQEKIEPLIDMSELDGILKESKVEKLQILPETGFIMINEPVKMQIQVGREANADDQAKALHKMAVICSLVEQAEDSVDIEGKRGEASSFIAKREEFLSALNLVGSPNDPIKLETGGSLTISSIRTGKNKKAIFDKAEIEGKASISLSKRAQQHLRRTLEGTTEEGVRVVISSVGPQCIFQNNQLTVLAGGMVKKS